MIKPEFFDDPDVADLSFPARLFFMGLWTQADKEGRLVDDMRRLKARIFPFDDVDCETLAVELHGKDMIRRYKTGQAGEKHGYIWIKNFTKHQRPHPKELESLIPKYQARAGEKHGEPGKNTASRDDLSGILILDPKSGVLDTESGERQCAPVKDAKASIAPEPPLDVWLREFTELYPKQARCASHLTETAFHAVMHESPFLTPEEAYGLLRGRLEGHKRSHQWRVKGMIPRLDKYLREGLHLQELPEYPPNTLVSEKTARTLSSAAAFVAGGEKAK